MNKPNRSGLVRRVIHAYNREILRGWQRTVPIALCVVIGTILIFYVPPLIIAQIIASESPVSLGNGWQYLVWFGLSWLGGEILWRIAFFIMTRFEGDVVRRLYDQTFKELLYKDLSFFNDRFAGSITKNILAYARRFESYFDTIIFGVISQVGPALFGLIILTIISPLLSLSLIVSITGVILLVRPFIVRRSKLVQRREQSHSEMSGHVSDVISNISAVRSFGAEKMEEAVHTRHAKSFADAAVASWHYHNTRIDALISPIYVAVNTFALGVILASGVDGPSKASLFLAFNYFVNISRFMWEFNGIYRRLEDALTDAALFIEYKDVKPLVTDAKDAKAMVVSDGRIEFDAVTFSHQGEGFDGLFKDFHLSIKPGQRVGIVGHSGAGKSTLVSLLLRFVDVDAGNILIDRQAIASVTQQSLHQSIAYVPQEPALFHRSLRDNIRYGKPDATDEEILTAATRAHATEFIDILPDGLDTLVGERGVKLSGGQRQRIAIARAILKDAPILVLDEATSALDSESERLIQASLDELMKGRTSIVIAHRLSTISKLDRIVVLESGGIIEDGTHDELLALKGTYASLWSHQSGGFIED